MGRFKKMNTRDWYDYLSFLKSQVKTVDLQQPDTIGDAYNNFQIMQDIEDVIQNKLPKKEKVVKKEA